ncbi:leucine-rich repeat domain-containing protein [Kitasatospora sp. NPDC048540]|uniref:leucine-rich repeat domain-containing protein n=1 Tax=Kitasatospora sp. NPDC048540 TaxID=3155634 RepID=UPI0033CCF525
MTTHGTAAPGYRIIGADEAEARFQVSAEVEYPFREFADEQEIRLYEGGLAVPGDLAAESDGDWVPYNVIVDGDLTVGGALDWWDSAGGNFLLVTGGLTARAVLLSGCPNVVVRGDLTAADGVQGSYGDDGGLLVVGGRTTAPVVISGLYFSMSFGEQPAALLAADPHRTDRPVDFTDDELDQVVLPALLDADGDVDLRRTAAELRAGRTVLRPGVRPAHLAALDELDALLVRAGEITELDLSGRKLRGLPAQLFRFPALRSLDLSDNPDLGDLDPRLGTLTALRELDLSGTGLRRLPDTVGDLAELRVLDISGNRFEALPDRLGALARLEVLRAADLSCAVPEALAGLGALRELDLSALQPGGYDDPVAFPLPVTALTGLRELSLARTWLTEVPDALLALTGLVHLDLRGSLSAGLHRLPDLARLPHLRVLRLSGHTPWTFQPEPDHALLDAVWGITTLEHLEIDRWGEKKNGGRILRPALTALPDDAFAATPGLRRLDLSFNELTTLPESFFALRHLEAADLRRTRLDHRTAERVRTVFPLLRSQLRE